MYFVDREKIEARLAFMEKQLKMLKGHPTWNSELEQAALERGLHTIIEAILDVGNAIIDGFIMRDPGSYDDIIDILTDEKVVNGDLSEILKKMIAHRKMLVQEYENVDHQVIIFDLNRYVEDLEQFPLHVRTYLTNELGPVSAFKK